MYSLECAHWTALCELNEYVHWTSLLVLHRVCTLDQSMCTPSSEYIVTGLCELCPLSTFCPYNTAILVYFSTSPVSGEAREFWSSCSELLICHNEEDEGWDEAEEDEGEEGYEDVEEAREKKMRMRVWREMRMWNRRGRRK